MKIALCSLMLICFVLITSGCKKDENPASSDQYTNKLALGTGIGGNGFIASLGSFYNIHHRDDAFAHATTSTPGQRLRLRFDQAIGGSPLPPPVFDKGHPISSRTDLH